MIIEFFSIKQIGPAGLPGIGEKGDKGMTGPVGLPGLPGIEGLKGDRGKLTTYNSWFLNFKINLRFTFQIIRWYRIAWNQRWKRFQRYAI